MATISKREQTAAELADVNPVLSKLTVQFESDTGRAKVGDGASVWADLPYSVTGIVAVPDAEWPPADPRPGVLYLHLEA